MGLSFFGRSVAKWALVKVLKMHSYNLLNLLIAASKLCFGCSSKSIGNFNNFNHLFVNIFNHKKCIFVSLIHKTFG